MEIHKKLGKSNESTILVIPATLCQYLELAPGDEVTLKDDVGKHGKFLSFWKKKDE